MRSSRLLLLLMMVSTAAFAQSDAQKTFEKLKALSGTWEGKVTMDMPVPEAAEHSVMRVTLRTTSRGNAVMHEMTAAGPDDPITMFYLDEGRLLLTHYCDARNRPRTAGTPSPDGKTPEVNFLDVAGGTAREPCIVLCSRLSTRTTSPKP